MWKVYRNIRILQYTNIHKFIQGREPGRTGACAVQGLGALHYLQRWQERTTGTIARCEPVSLSARLENRLCASSPADQHQRLLDYEWVAVIVVWHVHDALGRNGGLEHFMTSFAGSDQSLTGSEKLFLVLGLDGDQDISGVVDQSR